MRCRMMSAIGGKADASDQSGSRQLMTQRGHRSWLKAAIDRLSNRFGSTCDLADSAKSDAALGLLTLSDVPIQFPFAVVFGCRNEHRENIGQVL
jgi:hypothetical protein